MSHRSAYIGRLAQCSVKNPIRFALLLCLTAQHCWSTVFTTNAVISETNFAYDGQDIVIDGATVAIDGLHAFNSLLLTNGAVLTRSAVLVRAISDESVIDAGRNPV